MRLGRTESIFGVIDHPLEGQAVGETVQVRGWVISRVDQPVELEIRIDGSPVDAVVHRTPRPDVREVHARFAGHNESPGYLAELSLHDLPAGSHAITLHAIGKRGPVLLGRVEVEVLPEEAEGTETDPLYRRTAPLAGPRRRMLLVHIPKTAGTSLTAYLGAQYPRSRTLLHAENQVLGLSAPDVRIADHDLVTAHLKLATLGRHLDLGRYFTLAVLREPAAQLNSHLAWVRRLADPRHSAELNRSPDYLKQTVERITKLDLVEFIDTMVPDERTLFDNCQFRYFLPQGTIDVDESQVPGALERLASLDLVGTTERLFDFLLVLAFSMGWDPPQRAPRLNTGNREYFIDPDTTDVELRDRLHRLTRLDRIAHRQAGVMLETRFRGMVSALAGAHPDLFAAEGLTAEALAGAIRQFRPA